MNSFRTNPVSGKIRNPSSSNKTLISTDFSKGIEVGSHIKLDGDLLINGSSILKSDVIIAGGLTCEDEIRAKGFYVVSDERKKSKIIDIDQKLVDEYKWNDLVYNAKFSFEPVIHEVYHLYSRKNGELFLSLISPNQGNQTHIGTFKYNHDNKWIKI